MQVQQIFQAFSAWRERYRDKMESFEFFVGTGGGFGVFNVESEEELHQITLENPIFFLCENEMIPVVDGDIALKQWGEAIEAMQQMAGATA
jgi:hypothetical protein